MEYLGAINLFSSHFIIGCREVERRYTLTETQEIEALHKWLDFKDNDWGMRQYRTERTQYIDFLEIIDLEYFKIITTELYKTYSNEYPYATKKDFIKYVFEYTIYDLETFLNLKLRWLGGTPKEDKYSFYTVYSADDCEYLDYAINSNYTIEHYRQYYKVVIDYLKSFDEVTPILKVLPAQPINSEKDSDKYIAKHFVLAYLIECHAKGERFPIGQKKKLEKIGNEKMGLGKGNRFYKVFNEVTNRYDLNIENQLIEIGGENWRKAVIELSTAPELVEKYLQSKQL